MQYQVKDPQGKLHVIEGPEGATPAEVIARAQSLLPTTSSTDYGQVIGSAIKNAFVKPASFARDLGTNPETMANAMPTLMGTAGGVSPIPGGATGGTMLGQGVRDIALKALGKPVPGGLQHGLELGGAAMGDISAIPYVKGKIFGSQIGEAERAAGVVTRGAMEAVTPGTVGEALNKLESQVDRGLIRSAQKARDAKEIVDQVYMNPRIYEKSPGISVQAQRVSAKVQALLNSLVEGRAAPAQQMAKAMTIPNAIGNAYESIPWAIRRGAQFFGGGDIAGEILKHLIGRK